MTVGKILLNYETDGENILPALKKINTTFGFISLENSRIVADYFSVPLSQIYETASFYDAIKVEAQPDVMVQVCFSTHCAINHSGKIIDEIERLFHLKVGDENNPRIKLEKVSCFGRCGEGPIMVVNGKVYEKVAVEEVGRILGEYI